MNHTVRMWVHGLGAATIGGAANAVTVIILDPLKFNLQEGWKNLLAAVVVSSLLSAALYLKQSPLPPDEDETSKPPLAGIIKLLMLLPFLAMFTGCAWDNVSTTKFNYRDVSGATASVEMPKQLKAKNLKVVIDAKAGTATLTADEIETQNLEAIKAQLAATGDIAAKATKAAVEATIAGVKP